MSRSARRLGDALEVVAEVLGEAANGGLALDHGIVVVVVDVEGNLGGVGDPPHDDGGDLDRVSLGVVDL